jgi:hypothetical protein
MVLGLRYSRRGESERERDGRIRGSIPKVTQDTRLNRRITPDRTD